MSGFDFFRKFSGTPLPRTPAAAFEALQRGVGPSEAFVYLGTSVKPLNEEPIDLNELSRVLAHSDQNFETTVRLIDVFRKLSRAPDAERALFGSESISLLEAEYMRMVESLKAEKRGLQDRGVLFGLTRAYFQLSFLYDRTSVLCKFYLKEAYGWGRKLLDAGGKDSPQEHVALVVRILERLGLPAQADTVLRKYRGGDQVDRLFLEAETAFFLRDFKRVRRLLIQIQKIKALGDGTLVPETAYWTGME
jgi:hypothetical protein